MSKKLLITCGLAVAMFGGTALAASQADYDKALAGAKAAQKAAKAHGGEWRDIGKILKKAAKSAKKGDFVTAVKLAKTARFHGERGLAQAREQANTGNPGYLYN